MKKYQYASPAIIERKDGNKWIVCHVVIGCDKVLVLSEAITWIVYNAVGRIVESRNVWLNGSMVRYYKTTNTEGGFDFRVRFE